MAVEHPRLILPPPTYPAVLVLLAIVLDGRLLPDLPADASWMVWLGAALAALGVLWLAQRRLGGVTGDVFGAVVEVSEAVFVCVACVRW